MDALVGFTVILACILLVKPGDAIQCHQCSYAPFSPGSQQNCLDPFNTESIATTTCEGRCFANYTSAKGSGFNFEQTQRGCITDVDQCLPSFCQEGEDPLFGTSKYCSYCCDEDLCNSMGFEAATADTVNCWLCEANLTTGMDVDPASCSGDNFNGGDGALAIPCPGQKCLTVRVPSYGPGIPATFARTCGDEQTCALYEQLPGVEFECCDSNFCNAGSNIDNQATTTKPDMLITKTMTPLMTKTKTTVMTTMTPGHDDDDDGGDDDGGDDGDDDDDDNEEGTIECWRCDTEIKNKTDEDTACFTGNFPADNVLKIDCPSGTCISYKYVGVDVTGKESQLFSRGCRTPDMDHLGYCDSSNPVIKDAKCCTKTLCNGSAAVIALNAATMFSALIASLVCLYAMA